MLQPLTSKPRGKTPSRSHGGDERARLYQGRRWRRLRAYILTHEPLCRLCADRGYVTEAVLVDHVRGHGPDWREHFFTPSNLQPLCSECHAVKTQQEQRAKTRGGIEGFEVKTPANHQPPTTRQQTQRKDQ